MVEYEDDPINTFWRRTQWSGHKIVKSSCRQMILLRKKKAPKSWREPQIWGCFEFISIKFNPYILENSINFRAVLNAAKKLQWFVKMLLLVRLPHFCKWRKNGRLLWADLIVIELEINAVILTWNDLEPTCIYLAATDIFRFRSVQYCTYY